MMSQSLQSIETPGHSLTLFSSIGGGFSRADRPAICSLQDLLRIIAPLRLSPYRGSEFTAPEKFGEGASYRVFRCQIRTTSKFVAIKQIKLPSNPGSSDDFQKRLQCVLKDVEVMHHAPHLRHQNILTLMGYGWGLSGEGSLPFLVTELSDLGTMRDFLKAKSIRLMSIIRLCSDVASGLHTLHTSGVCHGDLKLENVLIFNHPVSKIERKSDELDYIAKISDFGHSCLFLPGQAGGSSQLYRGTRNYLPPEVLSKSVEIDLRKCDVWTFGLFLLESLARGTRYLEIPEFDMQASHSNSQRILGSGYISSTGKSSADHSVTQLSNLPILQCAYNFAESLISELSYVDRSLLKGVFKKSLQEQPANRCSDVSKLPLVHARFQSILPSYYPLVGDNEQQGDWEFEEFNPSNSVSMPEKVKLQLVSDCKAASHIASNALYVAFAYATGFGVTRSDLEFSNWLDLSVKQGSLAALLIQQIWQQPWKSKEVIYHQIRTQFLSKTGTGDGPPHFRQSNGDKYNNRDPSVPHLSSLSQDGCTPLHYLPLHLSEDVELPNDELATTVKQLQSASYGNSVFVTTRVSHIFLPQFPLSLRGSPLSFAVVLDSPAAVKALLEEGAPPSVVIPGFDYLSYLERLPPFRDQHNDGWIRMPIDDVWLHTPLFTAIAYHNVKMFDILWSRYCSISGELIMAKKLLRDTCEAALLIGALAQKSVIERMILHGPNYQAAQATMTARLLQSLWNLCQKSSEIQETGMICFMDMLSKGICEILKYGNLELAQDHVLHHLPTHNLPSSSSKHYRLEILKVALYMACNGCLSLHDADKYLRFARSLGDDLNPDFEALRVMISHNNRELFELQLLQDLQLNCYDSSGSHPLHLVVQNGFHNLVHVNRLLSAGAFPDCRDGLGRTPLHYAASIGVLGPIKDLLQGGADICAVDQQGLSVLQHAIKSQSLECVTEILVALQVKVRPKDRVELTRLFSYGTLATRYHQVANSTIHLASTLKNSTLLSLLLQYGVPCDVQDEMKNLPIHVVVTGGSKDVHETKACCDVLIREGSSPIILNHSGKTALHVAAENWRESDLRVVLHSLLQAHDADIDAVDSKGQTILHQVAASGDPMAVDLLLALGASSTSQDAQGRSPLHVSLQAFQPITGTNPNAKTSWRYRKVVECLLNGGANPLIRDHLHYTATDLANRNGTILEFYKIVADHISSMGTKHYQASSVLEALLSNAWSQAVPSQKWSHVEHLFSRAHQFTQDISLLNWPAGARFFRHIVSERDRTLLHHFAGESQTSTLPVSLPKKSLIIPHQLRLPWIEGSTVENRKRLVWDDPKAESKWAIEWENYVLMHSQDLRIGYSLKAIYKTLQSCSDEIIYAYFTPAYYAVALEFLNLRDVRDMPPMNDAEADEDWKKAKPRWPSLRGK